jgi:hypothetical protein
MESAAAGQGQTITTRRTGSSRTQNFRESLKYAIYAITIDSLTKAKSIV